MNQDSLNNPSATHYQVLGLSASASKPQIKQAYKASALKYHPDKSNHPNAKEMFHRVTQAYEHLYDQHKKQNYDAQLKRKAQAHSNRKPYPQPQNNHFHTFQRKQQPKTPSSAHAFSKADYSKYFKPSANPYRPKRTQAPPQKPRQEQSTHEQQHLPRKRAAYRLNKQRSSWTSIILTLVFFFLFWRFVPDFTVLERQSSGQPLFQWRKSQEYALKRVTSRYKVPYYIRPEKINQTASVSSFELKVQSMHFNRLQSECKEAMATKERYQRLIVQDPGNSLIWNQQLDKVSYKACSRIMKLVKKYPQTARRFTHIMK